MKPIDIIALDLFEKVRSRFTNLQLGDKDGTVTAEPSAARFFDFDFAVEGTTLGRVSISINDTGNLKIFYSQGITENADPITQSMWYDFLKEMRFFAKRRLLRFDTRDITKGNLDKTDFQYLAQNGPKDNNMNESSLTGSSKTSHRKLENTDLIIRHSEAIDPTKPGARSRKIKNLFIQNQEGERFKFPFVYLPGARAMQRHISNGGYPHDEAGKHIVKTCEEILKLSDFGRKVKHSTLNDNAHGIIERAGQKLKSLRHHMECMAKQNYYEAWKETYAPDDSNLIELDAATMESYKDTFTVNKFDEALSDMFPLLHSIMQEAGEIDLEAIVSEGIEEDQTTEDIASALEFAAFESWTDSVMNEGLSDDELAALEQIVQEPLPVGANDEAVQALAGVGIQDPALIKAIRATAAMPNGENTDARTIIQTYLGADAGKISFGDLDNQAPQAAPAQPAQTAAPAEEPAMAEAISPFAKNTRKVASFDGDHGATAEVRFDHENGYQVHFYKNGQHLGSNNIEYFRNDKKEAIEFAKQEVGISEDVSEGSYYGPEDFQDWLHDATHRVAHGKVGDWTELAAELTTDLGFDDNKAERIAQRIYGHEKLAPKRVNPIDLEKDIPNDHDDDDDSAFLNKLRRQARSGSIPQGLDTGDDVDEDDIQPDSKNKLIEKGSQAKEIAQIILGFYDRDKGTWTKGEHGVVTHVKRQFSDEDGRGGEKEAAIAAKLIQHLNAKHDRDDEGLIGGAIGGVLGGMVGGPLGAIGGYSAGSKAGDDLTSENKAFEDILRFAGLKKI